MAYIFSDKKSSGGAIKSDIKPTTSRRITQTNY